jgi:hypothetical protein
MLIPLSDEIHGPVLSKPDDADLVLVIDSRVPVIALIKALTNAGLVVRTNRDRWIEVLNKADWEDEREFSIGIAQLEMGFGPR